MVPASHGHVTEALGAYAVGALEDREREEVEAHLLVCEECRERHGDIEEAVTAWLGPDPAPPSPEVWEKIQAELRRRPP